MAFKLVVIGASLGGLRALPEVLAALPGTFPAPVALVQHREAGSDEMLIRLLQRHTALVVREVEDKTAIRPGYVYVAPADYHLLVEADHFALSTEPPVQYARPSIDVLFESAAEVYGASVVGVILTGASQDGAAGLAAIKQYGGLAVVQSPTTAESRVMPEAAIAATTVDKILAPKEIGPFLISLCRKDPKGL